MTPLAAALREKYTTPKDALRALGLDESLIEPVVSDAKSVPPIEEKIKMATVNLSRKGVQTHAAVTAYLMPKLAQDAKPDLRPSFAALTHANYKASRPALLAAISEKVKGKLAHDAKIDDLAVFLGAFDEMDPGEDPKPMRKADDEEEETEEEKEERLAKEKAAKDKKAKDAKTAKDKAAKDAENPFEKKDEEEKKAEDHITREAMDEALQAAAKSAETRILTRMRGARDAEAFVRPWVGALAVVYDSAEEIERAAAIVLNIPDADKIHASALRSLIKMTPKPGERQAPLAHDARPRAPAGATEAFANRYPDAARIRVL